MPPNDITFWLRYTVARANRAPFSFSFFFSKKTQEILDAIKKIHGYVYAIKKFGDICAIARTFFYVYTILDERRPNRS